MAQIKPETVRKRLKTDIESKMKSKGITSELYQSKLNEYMELYDHGLVLQQMAAKIAGRTDLLKTYLDCTKEIRQIRKSMRDILNWLEVTPDEEEPKEEDYDL